MQCLATLLAVLPSTEGGQCLADLVAKALVEGPVDANLDTITASVGTSISLGMCIQFTCEYSTLHYALYSTTYSYCTCFVVTACKGWEEDMIKIAVSSDVVSNHKFAMGD